MMWWVLIASFMGAGVFLTGVSLTIIAERFIKKYNQALENCMQRYHDKIPALFYSAVTELLEKGDSFKNSEELKETYNSLLELKARYEPFKEGVNKFIEMGNIVNDISNILLNKQEVLRKERDKKNMSANVFLNSFLARRKKVTWQNEIDKIDEKEVEFEMNVHNKALFAYLDGPPEKEIEKLKSTRNVFNDYFVKLERENLMLRDESESILAKNKNLVDSVKKIAEKKNRLSIDIDELQKQNSYFCAVMDKIKNDNLKMKKDIEAMDMLHYTLNTELKQIVEENKKLKEATIDWEYI